MSLTECQFEILHKLNGARLSPAGFVCGDWYVHWRRECWVPRA